MVVISSLCIPALYPARIQTLHSYLPHVLHTSLRGRWKSVQTPAYLNTKHPSSAEIITKALALKLQTRDKLSMSGARSNESLESLNTTDTRYSLKLANAGEEHSRTSCGTPQDIYRPPGAVKASVAVSPASSPSSFSKPFPLSSDSLHVLTLRHTQFLTWVTLRGVAVREGEFICREGSLWNAGKATAQHRHCNATKYLPEWIHPNRCRILGMKRFQNFSWRRCHPARGLITTAFIWKASGRHLLHARDRGWRGESQSPLIQETETRSRERHRDTGLQWRLGPEQRLGLQRREGLLQKAAHMSPRVKAVFL